MASSIKGVKMNFKSLKKVLSFDRRQHQSTDNLANSIVGSESIAIDDLRAPSIFTIENAQEIIGAQTKESNSNYQYYATICVNIIAIAHGAAVGFTSPFIPILISEQTPLSTGPISEDQSSWVVSIICLGGLVGTFLYGWMADTFGRKFSSIALAMPQMGFCLSIIFGTTIDHVYYGRFMAGLTGGGVFVLVPLYVSEIAEDKLRGTLGSIFIFSMNFGILFSFVAGNYLSYVTVGVLMMAFPIMFLVAFLSLPLPETPPYLIHCGKLQEAQSSLCQLRGVKPATEIPISIKLEFEGLTKAQPIEETNTSITWSDITSKTATRAFIIGVVLICVNQLNGSFTMVTYAAQIFMEAGSNLSPNVSAMVVGAIQLFGSYVSIFMVDQIPRRILYLISCIGSIIGLFVMGCYGLLNSWGVDVTDFSWIPIFSLSLVIFIASCGVLPLTFIILSEILPEKIRSFGISICTTLLWILGFLLLQYFSFVVDLISLHGSMFGFCGCVMAGMFYFYNYVPETKGRNIEDILRSLEN